MDWAKATARRDGKHLSLGIWCDLYKRFHGMNFHGTSLLHQKRLNPVFAFIDEFIFAVFFNESCNYVSN